MKEYKMNELKNNGNREEIAGGAIKIGLSWILAT